MGMAVAERLPGHRAPGPVLGEGEAAQLAARFEGEPPEELLRWALRRFGAERLAIVSSFQAETVVLIDMAWRLLPGLRVITVDTGRLPQATHEMMDRVRERYGVAVEALMPDSRLVAEMVRQHGANLFYRDVRLRLLCCRVRKVLPLEAALRRLDAWVTGLRRGHSPTRAAVRKVEIDQEHGGLVKLNPLADWSHQQVWAYIRSHGVPYHPYYDLGYTSIGCEPCTRPIEAGADPRSGRWWWEQGTPKECGMHCAIEGAGLEEGVS